MAISVSEQGEENMALKVNKSYFCTLYQTMVDRQSVTPPCLPSQIAPFNSQSNYPSGLNLGILSDFMDDHTNYLRFYLLKLILMIEIMFSKTEMKNPRRPLKTAVLGSDH